MTGAAPGGGSGAPLVLALDDPGAVPEVAGGKGASLGRLARAGLRVPDGFHVTTAAYLDFVDGGLRSELLAAVSVVDASDAGTFEVAAGRIGELFAGRPVPAATAAAIAGAYASLGGDDVPVAVRSSATVEDLAGLSAAGQHDTYLNVRGETAVVDAVRRCWASVWSARAIGYRASRGIAPDDVGIAVVVQRLVPAEAAGVLFTIDPVSGAVDQVVVSANWGLGQSVVAGGVTADVAVVDRASGALVSYQLGSKLVMTVADGAGTLETETPAGLRSTPVLSPDQAAELGRVGLSIERLYGEPVDVEWARADDELWVVQARPITTRGVRPAGSAGSGSGDEWNDSLAGDYLWTNGNLGEALPDVMTPATWSFIELFMTRMIFPPSVRDYRGYGRIGGRFYANVSVSMSLEAMIGISSRRFVAYFGPVLGRLPSVDEIPRAHLPRWKAGRQMMQATFAMVRRVNANAKRLPEFLASSPSRCDRLRASIERSADPAALASLWPAQVRPLLVEAADMLTAAGSADGTTMVSTPAKLAALVGEADAALLLSGQQDPGTGGASLASLGPVVGLARVARGEVDRDAFVREYGHRSAHEMELSIPRPAEDPGWPDDQFAAPPRTDPADADALLARQQEARAAAWERLARSDPGKATAARKLITRWAPLARNREAARSEVVRSVWVARTWVRRAGELTGHGDDLFFLELPEVFDLLGGERALLDQIPGRRAVYEGYRALPSYPALIRGRFDPARWAADPHRRVDYYDERAAAAEAVGADDAITGFPGAAGVVEGTARVLPAPEDGGQLGDGEILVTTVTNIGWTPIFPRAAAVVTDVGAPLSHAAIVARELGIPAVVGCGDATVRVRSGDRVRVDGGAGTVEILERA